MRISVMRRKNTCKTGSNFYHEHRWLAEITQEFHILSPHGKRQQQMLRDEEAVHETSWLEREYNPSLTIPDIEEILASRPRRAQETKAHRRHLANLRTGPHPREVLDLFQADKPKGTFVFIHGGFWQVSSKDEVSWIADGFVDQGYSAAFLNYPLCPEVSIDQIVQSIRRSCIELYRNILSMDEKASIVISGHSAGAYLAASLIAMDWAEQDLTPQSFAGALLISGLYDLAPLIPTSMNQALGLNIESAGRLNLLKSTLQANIPIVFAVGGNETCEFHRQSQAMAHAWKQEPTSVQSISHANHLTIIDGLADPQSALHRAVMPMLA